MSLLISQQQPLIQCEHNFKQHTHTEYFSA